MKKAYIGLATTPHDPAIAFVDPAGEVLFAESAERYLQNKRGWCSPPDDLIRMETLLGEYCRHAEELVVASTWTASTVKRSKFLFLSGWTANLLRRKFKQSDAMGSYFESRTMAAFMNAQPGTNIELQNHMMAGDRPVQLRSYDHHLTHAAAACYSSGFDEAVCAIVDGMGEGGANAFFKYSGNRIERLTGYPKSLASLGWFYEQLCVWCGFEPLKGEEWKVMGLAPYGVLDENIRSLLRKLISVRNGALHLSSDMPRLKKKIQGLQREAGSSPLDAANLAYTGQQVFCELFAELLNHERLSFSKNLVLGGGCALNSAWNGQVTQRTRFRNCFVFCAPADDGNAIGAALLACYQDNPELQPRREIQTPYLGSPINARALERLRRYGGLPSVQAADVNDLCNRTATYLCEGKIIGWMQGRAEFGPRALGNRSILADPRSPNVKERLNDQVKFREEFRPFAPSILDEFGPDYFENYSDTPYMERALRFREEMKSRVPGVVHVDGTGRLQTVKQQWNPTYHRLISAFMRRTGVPIVLNTSFNVMGKPIVHSVEDAVAVFLTSGLDILVIDDVIFAKEARLLERQRARISDEALI